MNIANITLVVTACCILNNICEINIDVFDDNWLEELQTLDFQNSSPAQQRGIMMRKMQRTYDRH